MLGFPVKKPEHVVLCLHNVRIGIIFDNFVFYDGIISEASGF